MGEVKIAQETAAMRERTNEGATGVTLQKEKTSVLVSSDVKIVVWMQHWEAGAGSELVSFSSDMEQQKQPKSQFFQV